MPNDMNEVFTEQMIDAAVITVPIDDTLSNSGEAADAAAVGAALATKADISQITGITVNGEEPDAQGAILLDASEIPMSGEGEAQSVSEAIDELTSMVTDRTAEEIVMGEEDERTVAQAIEEAGSRTADEIAMSDEDATTVSEEFENTVKIVEQTLTESQKSQARTNIGAITLDDLPQAEKTFAHTYYSSVSQGYNSNNILRWNGEVISPTNFENSAFLVILNASVTTGRSSMYLLILGSGTSGYSYWKIGDSDASYHPEVNATSSGSAYISWSGNVTAAINANIAKLY